jgi:hypothetical protein
MMGPALAVLLAVGFGAMTVLAMYGRWMAGLGGAGVLLAGAMLYQLVRRRSQYLGAGLGLFWLAIALAGLVLFLWGWF